MALFGLVVEGDVGCWLFFDEEAAHLADPLGFEEVDDCLDLDEVGLRGVFEFGGGFCVEVHEVLFN